MITYGRIHNMKKLLRIVVIGLLWCNVGFSGEMDVLKKIIKLPEDIFKGHNKGWRMQGGADPKTLLTPDYAFKVVNKSDGHPVRLGKQSIRFELRRGDCGLHKGGWNDCEHNSERHELASEKKLKGTTWHSYSIFIPDNTPTFGQGYSHMSLAQFHGPGLSKPSFIFNVESGDYKLIRRTYCHTKEYIKKREKEGLKCTAEMEENHIHDLILEKDLKGKWHDIVINVKWSTKKNGYYKEWINGKLVYHYLGSVGKPSPGFNRFKMGIYRGVTNKTPKDNTAIVYYDEIRYAAKKCENLKLEDLGYSCEELESQKLPDVLIDHIPGQIEFELTSLPTMDGKYKLTWIWINKTMDDKEIRKSFVIRDEVTIKNGKITFDKINNSKVISNKYREKISFINLGDKFMIKGSLDLDSSDSPKVTISGNSTKNEKGLYVAEGLWGIDNKKKKKEYIGIFLKQLN